MSKLNARSVVLVTCALFSLSNTASSRADTVPTVRVVRVPNEGIQPQVVVDEDGAVHLLYYKGDAGGGDLFYARKPQGAAEFAAPLRVNSQAGSAVAAGNIRGGQIALGRAGRVHVAWNGSTKARPKGPLNPAVAADSPYNGLPMLYSRSNPARDTFESQRCLMRSTFSLDGGGTVTADGTGNVYVAWHANDFEHPKGEVVAAERHQRPGGQGVWVVDEDEHALGESSDDDEVVGVVAVQVPDRHADRVPSGAGRNGDAGRRDQADARHGELDADEVRRVGPGVGRRGSL